MKNLSLLQQLQNVDRSVVKQPIKESIKERTFRVYEIEDSDGIMKIGIPESDVEKFDEQLSTLSDTTNLTELISSYDGLILDA